MEIIAISPIIGLDEMGYERALGEPFYICPHSTILLCEHREIICNASG